MPVSRKRVILPVRCGREAMWGIPTTSATMVVSMGAPIQQCHLTTPLPYNHSMMHLWGSCNLYNRFYLSHQSLDWSSLVVHANPSDESESSQRNLSVVSSWQILAAAVGFLKFKSAFLAKLGGHELFNHQRQRDNQQGVVDQQRQRRYVRGENWW